MNKRRWSVLGIALILSATFAYLESRRAPANTHTTADLAIAALSAPHAAAGFARAARARPLVFPQDHAAHPDFRSEWWYFTGHLRDATGRPFGFQLTLFRFELAAQQAPSALPSASAWRTPTVLLGHFGLSDIASTKFHAFERLSRALPNVAGIKLTPPAVWLDDWRIEQYGADAWRLHAAQDGVELTLELDAASAVVLQGEAGLSRKSAAVGNASYYYSIPKLTARGSVRLAERKYEVTGEAWLDREWSTSALSRQQSGWDWFALQLADGGSLMFYRLRQRNGDTDDYSAGSYVDATGKQHRLAAQDLRIAARGSWQSPHSGRVYPQGWHLELPAMKLTWDLAPRLLDQEWHQRFHYWEGAVTVTQDGQPAGLGYVELTGY